MYWNLQAAVETAEFAKEDVEYYKKDRDDAYNALSDSRSQCAEQVFKLRDLKKEVEILRSELEEVKRCHRKSEYNSQLYLHIASHFAGSQFKNAVILAKRGQLEERVSDRSCYQLELAVARAYYEMRLA